MLSSADKQEIQEAIRLAELQTGGEIRVHIDNKCKSNPVERAVIIFQQLKMHKTKDRNGVLIYLSFEDSKLAIIGDEGINKLVPLDFWESTKNTMIAAFKKQEFTQGICSAISEAGKQLACFFPLKENDKNELSNEISIEKE